MGDDYIIRNEITVPNDKSTNYEQIDLSLKNYNEKYQVYLGAGYVYWKYAYRKRTSAQLGYMHYKKLGEQTRLFAGFDMKLFQKNKYNPDIRTAAGIEISKQVNIMLEYYNGYIPYSTLDLGKINRYGISSVLDFY